VADDRIDPSVIQDLIRREDVLKALSGLSNNTDRDYCNRAILDLPAVKVQAQIDAAVAAERERCAKVAFAFGAVDMLAEHKPFSIAAAIRKGDQP